MEHSANEINFHSVGSCDWNYKLINVVLCAQRKDGRKK